MKRPCSLTPKERENAGLPALTRDSLGAAIAQRAEVIKRLATELPHRRYTERELEMLDDIDRALEMYKHRLQRIREERA